MLTVRTLIWTTAHAWCDGHSTSISACGVWEVRAEVKVSMREFHTHIYLDWVLVEFLSSIKKKKKDLIWTLAHQDQWKTTQQAQNNIFVKEWVLQENFLSN